MDAWELLSANRLDNDLAPEHSPCCSCASRREIRAATTRSNSRTLRSRSSFPISLEIPGSLVSFLGPLISFPRLQQLRPSLTTSSPIFSRPRPSRSSLGEAHRSPTNGAETVKTLLAQRMRLCQFP